MQGVLGGAVAENGVRKVEVQAGQPGPEPRGRSTRKSGDFGPSGEFTISPGNFGSSGNPDFGRKTSRRRFFLRRSCLLRMRISAKNGVWEIGFRAGPPGPQFWGGSAYKPAAF